MKPFFDTSVLIGGLIDFGPSSVGPIAVIDRLAEGAFPGAGTAWHCCLEFYSVATRLPEEYRLLPSDATTLLEREVFPRLEIGTLSKRARRTLLKTAALDRIAGGRLYDLHIAFVALALKATVLVTENKRHFGWAREQGVSVLDAQAFIKALDERPSSLA